MTDHNPDLDELVSAYLDGEATDDEVARVEADPELRARVETLRFVSRQVAAPVPPPEPDQREAAISAALAASSTAPNVVAISTARTRPAARTLRIASIAAVAAVVLLAVPLVLLSRDNSNDAATDTAAADFDTATQEEAPTEAEATAEEEAPTEESAGAEAQTDVVEEAPAAAAPSDEGTAFEGGALAEEEAPAETDKSADDAAGTEPFELPGFLPGRASVDSPDELAELLFGAIGFNRDPAVVDVACFDALLEEVPGTFVIGEADVDGRAVIFGLGDTADDQRVLTLVDADTCIFIDQISR